MIQTVIVKELSVQFVYQHIISKLINYPSLQIKDITLSQIFPLGFINVIFSHIPTFLMLITSEFLMASSNPAKGSCPSMTTFWYLWWFLVWWSVVWWSLLWWVWEMFSPTCPGLDWTVLGPNLNTDMREILKIKEAFCWQWEESSSVCFLNIS